MDGEVVKVVSSSMVTQTTLGHAGLKTQVPGGMCTVSNLSGTTGGIKTHNLVESDLG